jgi:hypothetical protein
MFQIILLFTIINIDSMDSIVYFNQLPYVSLNSFCERRQIYYKWNQFNEVFILINNDDTIILKQDEPLINVKNTIIRLHPPIKFKNQLFINVKDLQEILWNPS